MPASSRIRLPRRMRSKPIGRCSKIPGVLKIGQNLKFDWQIFAQRGITIAPYDDTLLMSYVVDAGRSIMASDRWRGAISITP